MHKPLQPTELPKASDDWDLSLKSCATEFFRWLRTGAEVVEQSPEYIKSLGDDLVQAWHDSAKR